MHFPNLSAAKAVVLDTETMGPDWRRDKPVGYVVTWGYGPDETAYYPRYEEVYEQISFPNDYIRYLLAVYNYSDIWTEFSSVGKDGQA